MPNNNLSPSHDIAAHTPIPSPVDGNSDTLPIDQNSSPSSNYANSIRFGTAQQAPPNSTQAPVHPVVTDLNADETPPQGSFPPRVLLKYGVRSFLLH